MCQETQRVIASFCNQVYLFMADLQVLKLNARNGTQTHLPMVPYLVAILMVTTTMESPILMKHGIAWKKTEVYRVVCSAFDQKSLYNGTISSLSDQWIRAEDLGMYGNSLQVIKTADTDATAILDGFTITRSRDGGIVLSEDATIRNCAVTQNFDHGITVGPNSDSIFTNCLIHDNYGEISGGWFTYIQ